MTELQWQQTQDRKLYQTVWLSLGQPNAFRKESIDLTGANLSEICQSMDADGPRDIATLRRSNT